MQGLRAWQKLLDLSAVLAALVFSLSAATARSESRPSQADLLRDAELAESRADPARAAGLYARARDLDPASRLARRADARLTWLEARSEGDWLPLRELLRMRSPGAELELSRVLEFERRTKTFPAGRVRRESWQLIAATYLNRLGEPARALTAYRAWLAEPGLDEAERQLATTGAAQARNALGDVAGSIAEFEAAGLERRPEAVELRLRVFSRVARPLAYGVAGAFLLLALALGGWRGFSQNGIRRAFSLRRLALGGYFLFTPLAFALLHSYDFLRVIGPLVLSCAAICLLASIAGQGLDVSRARPTTRAGLTALALGALLGAAYLTLDRSGALLALLTSAGAR